MKKKYFESLQMNISNSYRKKISITCISLSAVYLIAFFTRLFLLYSNVHKKNRHSNVCLKFLCDAN